MPRNAQQMLLQLYQNMMNHGKINATEVNEENKLLVHDLLLLFKMAKAVLGSIPNHSV